MVAVHQVQYIENITANMTDTLEEVSWIKLEKRIVNILKITKETPPLIVMTFSSCNYLEVLK